MFALLRGLSSQQYQQASPIPAGTPNATPGDSQASHESRNANMHEILGAESRPEDGSGKNTIGRKDNASTARPRSASPDALLSPQQTHHSEMGQRPDSSSNHQLAGSRSTFSRQIRALNPRLVLENSGSVARDHLASERTFLAYVRTSLAIASAGVALVQLFTIADLTSRNLNVPLSNTTLEVQKFARPLGVVALVFAFIVLVIGLYRYFLIQRTLPEQKFPTARVSIAFTAFVLGGVIIAIFVALLKGRTQ